jgi:AcrR family transcriptional regulator
MNGVKAGENPDQRREAGLRTRARLLDAALDLVAERGEDGVTLREVTDAAGANIAAVSYHFGSLQALRDAAIEHALERYLDAQESAVSALGPESTLEEVAAAFSRPMISALADGGRDLDVLRIVSRAAIDPPPAWDRFDARFQRIRAIVVRRLRGRVPRVSESELAFRTRCAAGVVSWLALAPVGRELRGKPQSQIERRVVPVVAGALGGTIAG